MATGGEIAEAVLGTVQDDSFDEDSVIKLLNDCVSMLSRRLILPSLDAEATVVTVTNAHSVALPATFQRNLYHCQDVNDWNAIEAMLDGKEEGSFTTAGLPNMKVLVKQTGFPVSKEEMEAVWATIASNTGA